MLNTYSIFISFSLLLLLLAGCNKSTPPPTEPPPPDAEPTIHLSLEGKTCTEAWIKLKVDDIISASVYNDDSLLANFQSSSIDTSFYQDNLLPNKSYTFKVTVEVEGNKVFSKGLSFQTLDTTSHNITYQIHELKVDYNSSTLSDVAIISENDIWVVGEIYAPDSTGAEVRYNAAHWNGTEWQLKKIYFYTFCSNPQSTRPYPANSIFNFDNSNIIVSCYDQIKNIGISNSNPICTPIEILKTWGDSSQNMYAVGNEGGIVRLMGSSYSTINSGTSLKLSDVWGSDSLVLAVATTRNTPDPSKLIKINSSSSEFYEQDLQTQYSSVWFMNEKKVFVGGSGVYIKTNGTWERQSGIAPYYAFCIRGTEVNDVWTVGGYGMVAHFNGVSWKNYPELYGHGNYYGLDVKDNIAAMVSFACYRHADLQSCFAATRTLLLSKK